MRSMGSNTPQNHMSCSVTSSKFVLIAATHKLVDIALKAHLEARLARFDMPTSSQTTYLKTLYRETTARHAEVCKRITILNRTAKLDPRALFTAEAEGTVHEAARALDVSLVPPEKPRPATPADLAHAVVHAQRHRGAARGEAAAAEFRLGEVLSCWPPDAADAAQGAAASAVAAVGAAAALASFAYAARTESARAALDTAARVRAPDEEAEAAARDAAERRFAARAYADAAMAAALLERASRLETVATLEQVPADPPALRLVHTTLAEMCGAADTVADFAAFPGVWYLPWVRALLAGDMVERDGLRVSKNAVAVEGLPVDDVDACTASLSACGTMCVAVDRGYGSDSRLYLRNLLSDDGAEVGVPDLDWACVSRGELFVAVEGSAAVRHAPLSAVFAALPFAEFGAFKVPHMLGSSALDRAADGRVVLRGESARELVCVDLHARASRTVACDRALSSVGGSSGVRLPGMLCVARACGRCAPAVAVFESGRTAELTPDADRFPLLLPSSSRPADLAAAAVLDCASQVALRGRVARLDKPISPFWQSCVRVYRDVFLCFDEDAQKWRAARVAVP
eukprot:gnl/Chilomastix_cuspidata/5009.p1 GENE.gnl/Chilomastix_cuspidata/5009~~gnl/Chilomastix_cuspidata/5009.p1  ORF type:complete len:573 (+),score=146.23 gnl/Chilomastix_cuspidata/5009:59-1777(+)